jgi:hypothetical protein
MPLFLVYSNLAEQSLLCKNVIFCLSGARCDGSLLHCGDLVHHLVHIRTVSEIPGVPEQDGVQQGHHEHDRPGRHYSLFYNASNNCSRKGQSNSTVFIYFFTIRVQFLNIHIFLKDDHFLHHPSL